MEENKLTLSSLVCDQACDRTSSKLSSLRWHFKTDLIETQKVRLFKDNSQAKRINEPSEN